MLPAQQEGSITKYYYYYCAFLGALFCAPPFLPEDTALLVGIIPAFLAPPLLALLLFIIRPLFAGAAFLAGFLALLMVCRFNNQIYKICPFIK